MSDKINIEDLQNFAEDAGLTHIVVLGSNGENQYVATWGKTAAGSETCATFGNILKKLLLWPDDKCQAIPEWAVTIAVYIQRMDARRNGMDTNSEELLDCCIAVLKQKKII